MLDVMSNGVFNDPFEELRLDATVALEIESVEVKPLKVEKWEEWRMRVGRCFQRYL